MKKTQFIIFVFLSFGLLYVLYNIWSLPFELLASRVILPVARVAADAADQVAYPIRLVIKIGKLDRDNRDLQQQNSILESEIVRIKEESRFCQQVGLEQNVLQGRSAVVARIIGRTPQNFNQTLTVDKGSEDGVRPKAAVLSNGYLVGQVKSTTAATSEITLITNHSSITPAILETSRELGLVQGSLEGLTLSDIPSATKVQDGEKVLSSGLGGEIPEGLLIGQIVNSSSIKGLFQTFSVESPFSLSQVEVLSILTHNE